MNPLYIETFRRHRRLFAMPVALAVLVAIWANVGAPKMYRSSASLWSDLPGAGGSDTLGATPPSEQERSMLTELLTTEYFRSNVARRGPLQAHLESHGMEGWDPGSLLTRLRGLRALEERIEIALGPKYVLASVQGPHVLRINYEAASPTLAAGTLRALLAEFRKERAVLRRGALDSYRRQLEAASTALARARSRLRDYVRDHPGARSSREVAALARAERDALERLDDATETFGEASAAALDPAAFQRTLRVIDAPSVPTAPTTGIRRLAMATVAGLFAGIVVSILGVIIVAKVGERRLAFGRATAHGDEEAAADEDDAVVRDAIPARRTRSG